MNDIELIDEIVKRAEEHQKQKQKEFAIAELEKIKAEIDEEVVISKMGNEVVCWVDITNILDNYIKKLKGDNN